ncbi:MAG: DUF3429 domain-containing protein [Gammaproteobacteria bacterium]
MSSYSNRYGTAAGEPGAKLTFYAALAAYGGQLPFIGLVVWLWTHNAGYASHVLAVYAAVVITFIGGVHWGWTLAGHADSRRYLWAMLPLVAGWILACLPWPAFSLPLLAVSVAALWYAERRWFADNLPRWYRFLCTQLAVAATIELLAAWVAVLVHAH